jgi:hypothetical protein
MMAAAGSLMAWSVGKGEVWCEGGDDGDEAERVVADAARAGRIGDIGGAGGAGESAVGEAGKVSDSTGGVSNIIASERIEEGNVENGGRNGGMVGGGIAGPGRGDRRSSPSFSGSRNSSALLCCLLTRLARGGSASGSEGGGSVAVSNRGAFLQAGAAATADGGCGCNWLSHAAVVATARPRLLRRRRRLPAVAVDVVEAGRMHVTVTVCKPAAWFNTTRAFSPLSMHCSYKAEKSAADMDGGGLRQAGSPTQVATPPLTTLAHVGEVREVGGRGEGFSS